MALLSPSMYIYIVIYMQSCLTIFDSLCILRMKDVFKDFVKEVLGIDDFKTDYNIYREKEHIDLLIEYENFVTIYICSSLPFAK